MKDSAPAHLQSLFRETHLHETGTAVRRILRQHGHFHFCLLSGFKNTFLKIDHQCDSENLHVLNDQIGTPTCAADLAQTIVEIIPQMNESNKGVYHFSDEGVCSWYDFAHEIMALSKLDCLVKPIPSSAYPTKAKRPFYSVLSKEKIKNTFHIEIPYWKDSLVKCLKQF